MLKEILLNIEIDYHWFYSALSQSLAALIGIVGMFTVYRLQIQMNNIYEATKKLQNYLLKTTQSQFFHLTIEETKERANEEIENYNNMIKNEEMQNKIRRDELQKGICARAACERDEELAQRRINEHKKEIRIYRKLISEITNRETLRYKIKWGSFYTILYLSVLFVASLVLLTLNSYFIGNRDKGFCVVVVVLFSLTCGIYFIIRCCWVSLDLTGRKVKSW